MGRKVLSSMPHFFRGDFSRGRNRPVDFELRFDCQGLPRPFGACWQNLFQSPVIASGFPVMPRSEKNLGLGFPLGIVAGILGTAFVNTFRDGIFLKGHSAVSYATRNVGDMVVWHLICKDSGRYMSYPQRGNVDLAPVSIDSLASMRHVFIWCKEAQNHTGLANGKSKPQTSKLGPADSSSVLDGFVLDFDRTIVGGTPYTLLNGHISLQIR